MIEYLRKGGIGGMDNQDRKLIERFDADFCKIASQDGWSPDDIALMKDLQKLMYYMEVRCAMKEGEDYPDGEYGGDMEYENRSYGNRYYDGYNMYGRNAYMRGGNGRTSGRRNYNGGGSYSSRRYYDGDKDNMNAMNDLRQMISMEQDPDKRSMLENIMHMVEK